MSVTPGVSRAVDPVVVELAAKGAMGRSVGSRLEFFHEVFDGEERAVATMLWSKRF